jgi:hypothetical protein
MERSRICPKLLNLHHVARQLTPHLLNDRTVQTVPTMPVKHERHMNTQRIYWYILHSAGEWCSVTIFITPTPDFESALQMAPLFTKLPLWSSDWHLILSRYGNSFRLRLLGLFRHSLWLQTIWMPSSFSRLTRKQDMTELSGVQKTNRRMGRPLG